MKIVLCGAGSNCRFVLAKIDPDLHEVKYIIDSDRNKKGVHIDNIPVIHWSDFDDTMRADIEAYIITSMYVTEIRNTLKQLDSNILIFNNIYDFEVYEYCNITRQDIKKNDLYCILREHDFTADTDKRLEYLEVYDRYFRKFKNQECILLEIGVFHGGSIPLWQEYFGEKMKYIGVDIDPESKQFETGSACIEIGSQEDPEFWEYIKEKYPVIDIIIDDGGHTMSQQIITFNRMFPHLKRGGCYLCEDTHTSYWGKYNGGINRPDTFVSYMKELADDMTIRAFNELFARYEISKYIKSVNFMQSCVVVEKEKMYRDMINTEIKILENHMGN